MAKLVAWRLQTVVLILLSILGLSAGVFVVLHRRYPRRAAYHTHVEGSELFDRLGRVDYNIYEAVSRKEWNFKNPEKSELNIPFYMYDIPELQRFENCNITNYDRGFLSEYYFIQSAKHHPWRVYDPAIAELFVVPIPLGLVLHRRCGDANTSHVKIAAEAIAKTPQYQREYGWDHLIMGTFFKYYSENALDSIAGNMTLAHKGYLYDKKHRYRCAVSVPYGTSFKDEFTGEKDEFTGEAYESWKRRPYNFFFQGQADRRAAYTIRRIAMDSLIGYMSPNILVVTSPKAPFPDCNGDDKTKNAGQEISSYEGCKDTHNKKFFERLRESKFNLYFRGDDFASKRLMDSFSTNTPVIVFADEWWSRGRPYGCHLPWDNMVIRGSESNFVRDPVKEMDRIVEHKMSAKRMVEVLELMEEYRDAVLWSSPNSYATTLTIFEAARTCIVGNEKLPAKQFQCPYTHETYTG
eukprot:Lankesteria_metandrocarpae@DN3429_c0_g1_i1.p1